MTVAGADRNLLGLLKILSQYLPGGTKKKRNTDGLSQANRSPRTESKPGPLKLDMCS